MDPIAIVQNRIKHSGLTKECPGVLYVAEHLQQAEYFYDEATVERNAARFNDCIYRSNQAFEGILKEAYQLFTGKPTARVNASTIEARLLRERILRTRVADLLKNYRQHWRNPSTHDHTLQFDGQEALLALLNVSAFVFVLIDQMIERVTFARTQSDLRKQRDEQPTAQKRTSVVSLEGLCDAVAASINQKLSEISVPTNYTSEIAGILHALFSLAPDVAEVSREPTFHVNKSKQQVDLLVKFEDHATAIEIKSTMEPKLATALYDRMRTDLRAAGVTALCLVLLDEKSPVTWRVVHKQSRADDISVAVVASESILDSVSDAFGPT